MYGFQQCVIYLKTGMPWDRISTYVLMYKKAWLGVVLSRNHWNEKKRQKPLFSMLTTKYRAKKTPLNEWRFSVFGAGNETRIWCPTH
jgi:hypothetical protein